MPYAPGVTDISGQLRAQGILGASQTYNQGMQQFAQSYTQMKAKQEADQELLAKARSTENFIKQHADQFGGEEAVKMLTATSPQETPQAKYGRLAQAVQDMAVGSKVAQDNAQTQEMQQRAKFQQQQMAQMQAQQQRQDAVRQQLAAALKARQQGAGQGVPMMNPDGSPMPQPAPTMQDRALDIYAVTGEAPGSNEITGMMSADSRDQVAALRDSSREQIAAATDATKKAQIEAKNASPKFTQHPETGLWLMTQNGQTQPLPGQVAKDPYFAEIDQLAKIPVADGGISAAQAAAAKKKLIAHRGTFSPNSGQVLTNLVAQSQGQAVAPGAPAGNPEDFWNDTSAQPRSNAPKFDPSFEGKTVRGPDGKLYKVQNGTPVPVQ